MTDFKLFRELLNENDSFLLTTHVNPDADAIGSVAALYRALLKAGKTVYAVNHSPTPETLLFLDKDNYIETYVPEKHDPLIEKSSVHIFLDLNQLDRVKSMQDVFRANRKTRVCIDHHQDPEDFADLYFTDTNVAATGEIIFELLKYLEMEMDREIALGIYAAIMTDTGSFRYERTNPHTHHITAELLGKGINPETTYDLIYEQSNPSRMKLLGYALSTLQQTHEGRLSYMVIRQKDLEDCNAGETDVEGFVNYCLSVKGAVVGIFFYELKNGLKMSFRSKGKIPVNKLAGEFGGGGHTNAAATRLYGDYGIDEYIKKVNDAAQKYLDQY